MTAGNDESHRTAEFHPTVWGDFFITHVFHNDETVSGWNLQIEALKEEVKPMLSTAADEKLSRGKLNLIDVIERLGIGYHFEEEIDDQLLHVYDLHRNLSNGTNDGHDLSTVALHFRLLRQHGYNVPSDTFKKFMDEDGVHFKKELRNDVEGLLTLYEAAHLRTHGENILEKATEFTTAELQSKMQGGAVLDERTSPLMERVNRALNGPKGVAKHEQLLFIACYERQVGHNPTLLSLAKSSWNVLQHLYHQELRDLTQWWIGLDFATKLPFARDRLVEIYYWTFGAIWEPKFSVARRILAKTMALVSVTDDIYDVRGTIEELELFTTTVERWDTDMKDLPTYMKVFFKALVGVIDEIGTITSEEGRSYCLEYVTRRYRHTRKWPSVTTDWSVV